MSRTTRCLHFDSVMPLTARNEKSQIKIFQCHLDNGFCEPTLQSRPPFPHRWLCRRCFTSRWWQQHTFQPSSGLVWLLTCAPAGSGMILCASPPLSPGNRSALVSLTGISAHGVRGSWQTPRLVFRLAPRSVNPTVLPGAHTAPANPLECVQLVTPPNSNTHLDPFVRSLSLLHLPRESLHSPTSHISKATKDNRYEKLQVWLCREMIYWCWELNLVIRHYLKRKKKKPTRPWNS